MESSKCVETGLSTSYAYKKGCRCSSCKANKAKYTARDLKANKRAKDWHKENPKRSLDLKKRHRDKTWLKEFSKLVKNKKAKCEICKKLSSVGTMSNSKKLHIDHCHDTGKIRGVLCGNCNVGLGHFKDSTVNLKNAIKYLKDSLR